MHRLYCLLRCRILPVILSVMLALNGCASSKTDNDATANVTKGKLYVLLNANNPNPILGIKDKEFLEYSAYATDMMSDLGWHRMTIKEFSKYKAKEDVTLVTTNYGITEHQGQRLFPSEEIDFLETFKTLLLDIAEIAFYITIIILFIYCDYYYNDLCRC